MDNALLLSLSNQMAAQRTMEIVSNNIANMNTTGFKRESPVFQEYVVNVDSDGASGTRAQPLSFVRDVLATHDMSNGGMTQTGAPFDVAISGEGFFAVKAEGQTLYTRNGSFGLDSTGKLVTSSGDAVLDEGGAEIAFAPDETNVTIGNDGTISTSQGVRGKLQVVKFDNPQKLQPVGNSLWSTDETAVPADKASVSQGMLEQSNVQPVVEMVRMMETMRSYQSSTELLNAGDDLSRRAVQRLGSVTA